MSFVEVNRLPRHVAIIMDGNGRWAQARGQIRTEGHKHGADAVRRTTRAARRLGISALTLYAFSEQNWDRPQFEVDALIEILTEFLVTERRELIDNNIRLSAVGRLHKLPQRARERLSALMEETAELDGMTLTLALSYGGREELVDAARTLAERVKSNDIEPANIDETLFNNTLPSSAVGPVDLLIRTGGEQRISNFLLWGSAYAEFYFTDELWPDFSGESLFEAVADYQRRERRFGRILQPEGARAT